MKPGQRNARIQVISRMKLIGNSAVFTYMERICINYFPDIGVQAAHKSRFTKY